MKNESKQKLLISFCTTNYKKKQFDAEIVRKRLTIRACLKCIVPMESVFILFLLGRRYPRVVL